MDKEKKQISLKTSKKLLIIGLCVFSLGLIITIISAISYKTSYNNFLQDFSSFNTNGLSGMPSPFFVVIGSFIMFISLPIIFIGLSPHLTKLFSKLQSETLDYAGKDISNAGEKVVDIEKPIINKEFDEIIIPNIKKVKESVIDEASNKELCPRCGDKVDSDEEFCSNCGLKLKEKCPNCGFVNDAKNNFCKKCGTKLK